MRQLSGELVREHGLTINDYEVLLYLANAPDRRMRRVDLATSVLVTASGITRILQGLEREGLVESATCASDGRVSLCLPDRRRVRALRRRRARRISTASSGLFLNRLDSAERELLARVLCRLAEG